MTRDAIPAQQAPGYQTGLTYGDGYKRGVADTLAKASPQPQNLDSSEAVEIACEAYAKATDYYIPFHRGLSSESSDRMRKGMHAALEALKLCSAADMAPGYRSGLTYGDGYKRGKAESPAGTERQAAIAEVVSYLESEGHGIPAEKVRVTFGVEA